MYGEMVLDSFDLNRPGMIMFRPDLGPNTLKSIQIHYNYFDLSMITITLQLQDL